MPNLKINNKTYSGVNEVHIPLASGSGNEDFAYITSETKSITENGTHDVKHYGTVNVNVPTEGEGIIPSGTKTITENGTYDVTEYASAKVALPTATQATPSISVSSSGLITASATQSAGVVSAGTKSATKQLSAQVAKTVTPGTSNQTAVEAGKYTTGAVTVAGDSKLVAGNIKSGVSIFGVTGTYAGSGSSAPKLQTKSATPSETAQTVTPDNGYDGLSSVSVGAISKTYVGSGVTKKSAQTYTPGTSNQTIASGQYLNGTQTIQGDSDLVAGNIKKGVSIFGVTGTLETASDPVLQSKTVSPSTSKQTVTPDSGYDGLSQVTVNAMPTATLATPSISVKANGTITASLYQNNSGYVTAGSSKTKTATLSSTYDSDFIASNIKKGVTIFGLEGTYEGTGGLPDGVTALATGTVLYESTTYAPYIEHGLGVVPNFYFVVAEGAASIAEFNGRMIAHLALKQTLEGYSGYYANLSVSSGGSVTNNTQPIKADNISDYFNETTIKPYGFFQTGKKYRWYAGTLNMIS